MNSPEYQSVKTIRLMASRRDDLIRAATLLRDAKLVALPTETVYGLAANGLNDAAIEKIFVAKSRPLTNPLILHVHDADSALALFDIKNDRRALSRFQRLAQQMWPGPLTLVAKKAPHVPLLATAKGLSVAVRIPANGVTRALIKEIGFPLVMPSANLSTRPSPTTADHVLATLDGRIDAVVDDGACDVGIESSVVKIDDDVVRILRPGMIDARMLAACLDEEVEHHTSAPTSDRALSPGLAALHYSPLVASVTVCQSDEVKNYWLKTDTILLRRSDYFSLKNDLGSRSDDAKSILTSDDPRAFARELYEKLYDAERDPHTALVIVIPHDNQEAWSAIVDRLRRAARS